MCGIDLEGPEAANDLVSHLERASDCGCEANAGKDRQSTRCQCQCLEAIEKKPAKFASGIED